MGPESTGFPGQTGDILLCSRSPFLIPELTDILAWILLCGGLLPCTQGMLGSILVLYSLDASSSSPVVTPQNISRHVGKFFQKPRHQRKRLAIPELIEGTYGQKQGLKGQQHDRIPHLKNNGPRGAARAGSWQRGACLLRAVQSNAVNHASF